MRALIFGVSGQDGAYLSEFLLNRGYQVWGVSRDAAAGTFSKLRHLGILERVKTLSASLTDFRSVLTCLVAADPQEVYNLGGQSSVSLSFEQPVETMESLALGTLTLLEAVRFTGKKIRVYNAGSSECFGNVGDTRANEDTLFRPRSPYGVAKSAAHWEVVNYREAYGVFACNGILFNHESPLRPERFVTRKVISAVARIAKGSTEKLHLGNIEIVRDWGWAPEYVQAMWTILQQPVPADFVIATGHSYSLKEFVAAAFEQVGLDWESFVERDKAMIRPSDIRFSYADPSRAEQVLGWRATKKMHDVVRLMLAAELADSRLEPRSDTYVDTGKIVHP
ncbi:MAG: GDP-mannose 4,6-dehydratase [Candidatus Korobacteraceae bacterium]|jgi:GDPmannose 4,6-dehydratase